MTLMLFATLASAQAAPKRVLFLNSYGTNFSPFAEYTAVLRTELARGSSQPVDIYDASLATARFAEDEREAPFVDYLLALFSERRLDLVVTIGAPAARFAQRYRDRLFPSVPFLVTVVEQRRLNDGALTDNDAAVSIRIDLSQVIENILTVLPETSNIAVILGASPNEKFWLQQLKLASQQFSNRVRFTWFNNLSLEEMQTRVAELPSRSAILFTLLNVDAAGVPHEGSEPLSSIHAVASAPIFSYVSAHFGQGIVGGPLISIEQIGQIAAQAAIRILRGEAPGGVRPPPVELGTPTFDWRELQRWGIAETALPSGSIVQFRERTTWERYRWQLLLAVAITLVQTSLIAGLLLERQRRRTAEAQSRGRLVELAFANRVAAASAMSSSIAHELNQPLGAILNNAEAADILLSRKPLNIKLMRTILADIRDADRRASAIVIGLRELLRRKDVKPQTVELGGVVHRALHLLDVEARAHGVEMSFDCASGPVFVCADQVHLEQVLVNLGLNAVQAMSNDVAGKRSINFKTARAGKSVLEVTVSDTGPGIPADKCKNIFDPFFTTKSDGTGLGLSIVRTIVEAYGGKVWAENNAGDGATFHFTLPLAEMPAEVS